MNQYKMKPFVGKPIIEVTVPGSKSITNRALLLAALSEGKSVLKGVLFSDDSRVFMEALKTLGYEIDVNEKEAKVTIVGHGTQIPKQAADVYVGSAGTAARFLTAMLALSGGHYHVTSSKQMQARPMRPLLEALECLGAKFQFLEDEYCFPFEILGREESSEKKKVPLNIDASSQFLSALLLNGVFSKTGFDVVLTGKRDAKAYVKISMKMMEEFGVSMRQKSENEYEILPLGHYTAREYQIEPDVSAACYFYAAAAITGGSVLVRSVHSTSMQGDMRFLNVLEKMGCDVKEEQRGIRVTAPADGTLHGIEIDMNDFSDQSMTLAAIAPFAKEPVYIKNIGHIRLQESDRIHAIVTELARLGVRVEEEQDAVKIYPSDVKPAVVQTYDDHRMAMSFALIGLKVDGIVIDNYECCKKTFENYFDVLESIEE